jgi:hypothetical protein
VIETALSVTSIVFELANVEALGRMDHETTVAIFAIADNVADVCAREKTIGGFDQSAKSSVLVVALFSADYFGGRVTRTERSNTGA